MLTTDTPADASASTEKTRCINRQDTIVVTVDDCGHITMRQEDPLGGDDAVIMVNGEYVAALIDILYEFAGGLPPPSYGPAEQDASTEASPTTTKHLADN